MFHLSLPIDRYAETLGFYASCFNARIDAFRPGSANVFVFGAQLTFHDKPGSALGPPAREELHFGPVVPIEEWRQIRDRLVELEHQLLHCEDRSAAGGRAKLLFADPSGNLIEVNSAAP